MSGATGRRRGQGPSSSRPDDEETDGVRPAPRPSFSAALADDLTAHRTAALRAMLADRPDVALAALAYTLAQPVFYATGDDSRFALHVVTPALRAEGIEDSKAVKHGGEQHAAWQSRLPEDEAALWNWLLAQDAATVTGLLAYCVACTVKPVRGAAIDRLSAAVALDMAQWWQPTVAGYLGRVPKPLIIEAVTEGKSAKAAENIAMLKKGDMAARAADLLAEDRLASGHAASRIKSSAGRSRSRR